MIAPPELSADTFRLQVERTMTVSAAALYRAWTEQLDRWFAAPGTVLMRPELDVPFFFETHFAGQRHPHYGRFLRLVPDRLVELTWVTGDPGTRGAETVLTIELTQLEHGARLRLTHAGFADEESRNGHREAWPHALDLLEQRLQGG